MKAARWPLLLIASPAAVAIWSGWVGLGELCGFGPVQLLPGITDWTLNTAITLPIGVEAYAAYALGAWMAPGTPGGARRFAMWSALGALVYGMLGQIIYHLLAAAHAERAPWPVVVLVSCMPVAVVGLAAALTHLLRAGEDVAGELLPAGVSQAPRPPAPASVAASLPKRREIQRRQNCSQATAEKILKELRAYKRGQGGVSAVPPAALPPVPALATQDVPAGMRTIGNAPAPAGTHNGQGPHV